MIILYVGIFWIRLDTALVIDFIERARNAYVTVQNENDGLRTLTHNYNYDKDTLRQDNKELKGQLVEARL